MSCEELGGSLFNFLSNSTGWRSVFGFAPEVSLVPMSEMRSVHSPSEEIFTVLSPSHSLDLGRAFKWDKIERNQRTCQYDFQVVSKSFM